MSMPTLFIAHGSPMNVIEENKFAQKWAEVAAALPRPKAVLCISAHWYTDGHYLSSSSEPQLIYDFYGFPDKLYEVRYHAPGAPELARQAASLLGEGAALDDERGLDHGAWCVLKCMYPEADVPVCQLSVNANLSPKKSYEAGMKLRPLRDDGVLIVGSGNVVHNLSLLNWGMENGYPWADEFDLYIKDSIINKRHEQVCDYKNCEASTNAFYYRDHFDPLLYVLGAALDDDDVTVFNEERIMGALSMTSYLWQ